MVAVREDGVPSLCLSSSLKLFNLSERRHDISKLHPKVGHSCGEQRGSGQGCLVVQLPVVFGAGTATLPIPPIWWRSRGGRAQRRALGLPNEFVGAQLTPAPPASAQTWLLAPLEDLPKASSPSLWLWGSPGQLPLVTWGG